jgi:hypothetical protein
MTEAGGAIPTYLSHSWGGIEGGIPTQVIHAPLDAPNAISHAGSRDWKYSSGWKKVRMVMAFTKRRMMRRYIMSLRWYS